MNLPEILTYGFGFIAVFFILCGKIQKFITMKKAKI